MRHTRDPQSLLHQPRKARFTDMRARAVRTHTRKGWRDADANTFKDTTLRTDSSLLRRVRYKGGASPPGKKSRATVAATAIPNMMNMMPNDTTPHTDSGVSASSSICVLRAVDNTLSSAFSSVHMRAALRTRLGTTGTSGRVHSALLNDATRGLVARAQLAANAARAALEFILLLRREPACDDAIKCGDQLDHLMCTRVCLHHQPYDVSAQ